MSVCVFWLDIGGLDRVDGLGRLRKGVEEDGIEGV